MTVHLTLSGSTNADAIEQALLSEISRLESVLSRHEESSELRRVRGSTDSQRVSRELFDVLVAAESWWRRSDGIFDPVAELRQEELAAIGDTAGFVLDSENGAVTFAVPDVVDLDGLAKGVILDLSAKRMREQFPGLDQIVVEIGGDLVVLGDGYHRVTVADPRSPADNADPLAVLRVGNRSVASSGGYARTVIRDGVEGSHIVDPRSGGAAAQTLGTTVVAENGCDADALATVLSVLDAEAGLDLVESLEGVECVVVSADGIVYRSSGFGELLDPAATVQTGAGSIASTGQEVSLEFTLQAPEGGESRRSYRRPYVAAWVESPETGDSVRTLCLWIQKRRWLRDLRTWYREHREDRELIDSVSRATRRAGSYELVWKGRSDDGETMPVGQYTICLEVAREHGTHQLIRVPVTLGRGGSVTRLPSNEEISGGTVTVRSR
ncbi:MAG: DUF2271 domain-containing protein [Planctomycetota bacterium]